MLYRYAPNASRRFFYPYPSRPPVQSLPPFFGSPGRPGSVPGSAAGIAGIAGKSGRWLEQARQVMAAAEQMRPLVEQYGPMVRNLPSMWKLYRAVQSMPDPDSETEPNDAVSKRKPQTEPVQEPERVKKQTAESVPWFPGRIS